MRLEVAFTGLLSHTFELESYSTNDPRYLVATSVTPGAYYFSERMALRGRSLDNCINGIRQ